MKTKSYINSAAVRALAKTRNRRVSKAFLEQLSALVARKVEAACQEHNGGKKTLDLALASYIISGGRVS